MGAVSRWVRKASLLIGRGRFRSGLDEEMEFHRLQTQKDWIAGGMEAEEARYAAMRQLGNATRLRERSEETVGFRFETVVQDLRFSVRQMRKSPGFAATAVLILSLGVATSVAIFAFVDAALIKPLPYKDSPRLGPLVEGIPLGAGLQSSRPHHLGL